MKAMRKAATVMLLRPSRARGFQVLMLKRSKDLAFAGGAYVFPGGSLSDGDSDLFGRVDDLDDETASSTLNLESGGLAYYVAAAREVFEECGILLGYADGSGALPSGVGARPVVSSPELARSRSDLLSAKTSFRAMLEHLGVRLQLRGLRYVAHWITPVGVPRRFDTRFFVVTVPAGQEASADRSEAVSERWISPRDALAVHSAGRFQLVLPTLKNLEFLARAGSVEEVIAAADRLDPIQPIMPRLYEGRDGVGVALPGSSEYEAAGRVELGDRKLPG